MLCKNTVVASRREFPEQPKPAHPVPIFSSFLKGLYSYFRRERTILIRDVATRESTRGMTFAASTAAPSLLLHPPFRISLELFKGAT